MNTLDRLYAEDSDPKRFARGYLTHLAGLLEGLDTSDIAEFVRILIAARDRGNRIFFVGNGGSAATASHFANDIGVGTRSPTRPFRAVSLTDNAAVVTAIANDDGYDMVFVLQLETHMQRDDVVVAISASGNSPNVVKAIEFANANGAVTVGLTGFDGGRLKEVCRHAVHVPTAPGEYGPVEDAHMVLDHLIGSYLIRLVRGEIESGGDRS